MKMKMRGKISMLVVGCVVVTALCCGVSGVSKSFSSTENSSKDQMVLFTDRNSANLNSTMLQVQSSVDTLASECLSSLTDLNAFQTSSEYVDSYTASVFNEVLAAADNTDGALTCYIRFNPDLAYPTSGIFLTRNSTEEEFESVTPTDFSAYDPSDLEHVGWYYTPVNNGAPLWMDPYVNENIGVYMISYVVPIYIGSTSVGIVGMDIDFTDIQDSIAEETIFDNGYSFLVSSADTVLYHPSMEVGETPEDYILSVIDDEAAEGTACSSGSDIICYDALANGMKLVTVASKKDVTSDAVNLGVSIVVSGFIACVIAMLIGLFFGSKVTKPLTIVTKEIKKLGRFDFRESENLTKLAGRSDEIGEIGVSALALQEAFNDIVIKIRNNSDNVVDVSSKMDDDSTNISGSVREIESAIGEVAEGATNQAGETFTVKDNVDRMEEIVTETENVVEGFRENSEQMRNASNSAHEILKELDKINQETKEVVEDLKKQTKATGDSVEKIKDAVQMITDIASKTNLLALNANIEAARAGEAGKGFAVVATEIQQLAVQSNNSADQIRIVIEDLLSNSESSARMMGEISDVMSKQNQGIADTGNAFNLVAEEVDHTLSGINEISEKINEIGRISGEITGTIDRLNSIAESNAASAEETSSSTSLVKEYMQGISQETESLHSIAKELQESISIFTI